MKIYVASSWRNGYQQEVVAHLRDLGHDVYDFRNPAPGDHGFSWSDIDPNWKQWTPEQYREALRHPVAKRGHDFDMGALRGCDACVLVLPSGRSASWEFGFAMGDGKLAAVFMPEPCEPELMYRGAEILCSFDDLDEWGSRSGCDMARAVVELSLEGDGDEALAKQLCQAGVDAVNEAPTDCMWAEQSHKRYFGILAKAREVLGVEAKDEEIARLKADVETLKLRATQAEREEARHRENFNRASAAAANARREALEEVIDVANKSAWNAPREALPWINEIRLFCHRERDASQPDAETPQPNPPVSLPIITGPLTDVPGNPYQLTGPQPPKVDRYKCEHQGGSGNTHPCPFGCNDGIEQPPARDVDGLAREFRMLLLNGMHDDDDVGATAKRMAEIAIAYLDGGPRT